MTRASRFVAVALLVPLVASCYDASTPRRISAGNRANASSGPTNTSAPPCRGRSRSGLPEGVVLTQGADGLDFTITESAVEFVIDTDQPIDPGRAAQVAWGIACVLRTLPFPVKLEVVGFASADGPSAEYDLELSGRRATKTCQLLATAGLDPSQLECVAGGRSDVAPPGPGPEDRRVEIHARAIPNTSN